MPSPMAELRHYVTQREPLSRDGVAKRICRFIESNRQIWQRYWAFARDMHRYAGGHQWPEEIATWREDQERPALVVNKTEVAIDSFTGRLQTERFQARVAPENYEEPIAGPLDQYCMEQRRRSGGEWNTEDTFRDMWIGSIGCQRITPYQDGPFLMERRDTIPAWEMGWDGKTRKQNFTDRRGHVHARYITAYEFRRLFGDETKGFFEVWNATGGASETPSWPLSIEETYLTEQEMVLLYTHEWRDTEPCIYLRLPASLDDAVVQGIGDQPHDEDLVLQVVAQTLVQFGPQLSQLVQEPKAKMGWTFTVADFKALEQVYLKVAGEPPPPQWYQRLSRERYYRANMVGNQLVGQAELIPEQRFTYLFMTDNMVKDPDRGHRPRSYIASKRDEQDAMNRALSGLMDGAGRSIKNVLFYITGLLKNPAQAQEQLTQDGGMVECQMNPVRGQNYDILQTKPSPIYMEVFQILEKIWNEEVLSTYEQGGVQDLRRTSFKALSSVTQNARGKQGSRYRAYSIALAEEVELQVYQAHAYYSYEEMLDIVGPGFTTADGQPILPLDRRLWLHALRRQVAIKESPYTVSERDELFAKLNETGFWQSLVQMLPPPYNLRLLAELVPPSLAASSPKAFDVLREAIQALSQPQPPPQEGAPPPGEQPNR